MKQAGSQRIGMKVLYSFDLLKAVQDENGDQVYDENGIPMAHEETRRRVASAVPNLFLTAGRNHIGGNGNWAGWCHVGTDPAPADPAQTGLLGFVASTNQLAVNAVDGASSSPPHYGFLRRTFRFAQGDTAANLNEVGLGWLATGAALISRARIVDITGTEVTVTPLADEILDVTTDLRYYAPLGDVLGTIVLDGITYNTITRASNANNVTSWGDYIGAQVLHSTIPPGDFTAYDGAIGSVIQAPSGNSQTLIGTTPVTAAYGNNNYYVDIQAPATLTGWYLAAGIRCVTCATTAGVFQTQFTAQGTGNPVPKSAIQSMSLTWRIRWGGYHFESDWDMETAHDTNTPTTGNWNTNTAKTLLRVNWTTNDTVPVDRQLKLRIEIGTTFIIYEADEDWVEYTTTGAYSEGADYTSYVVTAVESGTGPTVGPTQVIRVITP